MRLKLPLLTWLCLQTHVAALVGYIFTGLGRFLAHEYTARTIASFGETNVEPIYLTPFTL